MGPHHVVLPFYVGSGVCRDGGYAEGGARFRAEENQEPRRRLLLSGGCEDDFV